MTCMGIESEEGWSGRDSRARLRHGRSHRSVLSGRNLAPLSTRKSSFDRIIGDTVEYLKHSVGAELAATRFEVASLPDRHVLSQKLHSGEEPLWYVNQQENRVILY